MAILLNLVKYLDLSRNGEEPFNIYSGVQIPITIRNILEEVRATGKQFKSDGQTNKQTTKQTYIQADLNAAYPRTPLQSDICIGPTKSRPVA